MSELQKYPLWREAIKTFIQAGMCEPGTIITDQWKQTNFGLERPAVGTMEEMDAYKLKLLSAFDSFRDELLQVHQIHMKPVGKGAHVVIPTSEQTSDAWSEGVADIKRAMRKMKVRITNVNHALLTAQERNENVNTQARLSMMVGMHKKATKGISD